MSFPNYLFDVLRSCEVEVEEHLRKSMENEGLLANVSDGSECLEISRPKAMLEVMTPDQLKAALNQLRQMRCEAARNLSKTTPSLLAVKPIPFAEGFFPFGLWLVQTFCAAAQLL